MDIKNISTIERALGIIEGVACGVSDPVGAMLITAIDMIEDALREEASHE